MLQFVLNHPALLALLGLPSIPALLGRLEKAAIGRLLSAGDKADQKLVHTVIQAVVVWAEEKGAQASTDGTGKFAMADKLVARAMPFLTADQRKDLIQNAVDEMDKAAHDALMPPPAVQ